MHRPSGDDAFLSYRTSTYKLHYFSTATGFKFVMLSDPSVDSLRMVLRQIYAGAFQEFVVRNAAVALDSAVSGRGIDNDSFRRSVDGFVRSLPIFE
jgi:hypothetical protein